MLIIIAHTYAHAASDAHDVTLYIIIFKLMLQAFETYCTKQAASSMLLATMEREKELLRVFLKVNLTIRIVRWLTLMFSSVQVSQMENKILRRMNLSSFLMVPVQRITKYPLLLARLLKVPQNTCSASLAS